MEEASYTEGNLSDGPVTDPADQAGEVGVPDLHQMLPTEGTRRKLPFDPNLGLFEIPALGMAMDTQAAEIHPVGNNFTDTFFTDTADTDLADTASPSADQVDRAPFPKSGDVLNPFDGLSLPNIREGFPAVLNQALALAEGRRKRQLSTSISREPKERGEIPFNRQMAGEHIMAAVRQIRQGEIPDLPMNEAISILYMSKMKSTEIMALLAADSPEGISPVSRQRINQVVHEHVNPPQEGTEAGTPKKIPRSPLERVVSGISQEQMDRAVAEVTKRRPQYTTSSDLRRAIIEELGLIQGDKKHIDSLWRHLVNHGLDKTSDTPVSQAEKNYDKFVPEAEKGEHSFPQWLRNQYMPSEPGITPKTTPEIARKLEVSTTHINEVFRKYKIPLRARGKIKAEAPKRKSTKAPPLPHIDKLFSQVTGRPVDEFGPWLEEQIMQGKDNEQIAAELHTKVGNVAKARVRYNLPTRKTETNYWRLLRDKENTLPFKDWLKQQYDSGTSIGKLASMLENDEKTVMYYLDLFEIRGTIEDKFKVRYPEASKHMSFGEWLDKARTRRSIPQLAKDWNTTQAVITKKLKEYWESQRNTDQEEDQSGKQP